MVLHVLVCTLDEGITRVPHLLKPEREDVRYVVSFQYSDEKFLSLIPDALRREDAVSYTHLTLPTTSRV